MEKKLKIGCSKESVESFKGSREKVILKNSKLTDICVCVLDSSNIEEINRVINSGFEIPIILIKSSEIDEALSKKAFKVFDSSNLDLNELENEIDKAAKNYEENLLPPFFGKLVKYTNRNNTPFDCPGHQGGEYYKKHPAGKFLVDFFGENIFKADICNADVSLGDLLIHEGPAKEALDFTKNVFNSDQTYFVMNGTSTSNNVVLNALVREGDLVLFDRNNHKSIYDSSLIKSGGEAIFLETSRNPLGFIGGIDEYQFDEKFLMDQVKEQFPDKAKERPFRVAVI